jgi:NAD(P)-dependent dehydrogenase (short-subunit alcohol dehydrogenase family)
VLKDLFDLTGKTVVITGGSRGLGLQIAEAVCEYGGNVVLVARNQDDLNAAANYLKSGACRVDVVSADLKDPDVATRVIDQAARCFGTIEVLVNNAGKSWASTAETYPLAAWEQVMAINSTLPFLLAREVGHRHFIPRRSGKILNIASIAGLRGNRPDLGMNVLAYNASKSALIGLTRALASEWGTFNINVNALCPGFFPTQLSVSAIDALKDKLLPTIPLARFGGAEDLKGPALLLISEAGRHITGQCIVVDGGAVAV